MDNSGDNTTGGWTNNPAQEINWLAERNYTLYSANFMNYLRSDPTALRTRLAIVQEVVASVVNSVSGINIGLMRFSQNQEGGQISYAMEDINTARPGFIGALNAYTASGPTPLTEVLWEAMRYYRGDPVDYGVGSTIARPGGMTPGTSFFGNAPEVLVTAANARARQRWTLAVRSMSALAAF